MRRVFPFEKYEMITKGVIQTHLDAAGGDERQACMNLIAFMIEQKVIEEGDVESCALMEEVSLGCSIVCLPPLTGIRE